MNQNTKQRVIGIVVLLALALIFLPILFDGDGDYQSTVSSRIPTPPTIELLPEPSPVRPEIDADRLPGANSPVVTISSDEIVASVEELANKPPPVEDTEVEDSDAGPALDETGLPEGWSVRLGIFSSDVNASNLYERLLAAGYRAYTRELDAANGTVTGVFVGPQVLREEADQLKQQLQNDFQMAGMIVKFEIQQL